MRTEEKYLGYVDESAPVPLSGFHLRNFDSGWVQIFRDGALLDEGHSLRIADVITCMGYCVTCDEVADAD